MTSQKVQDNFHILQKNLILFSKMLKFETMIRDIYLRIEVETLAATRVLRRIALEEKEERDSGPANESTDQENTTEEIISDISDAEESKS